MEHIRLASGAISVVGACTIACGHCYSNSSPMSRGGFDIAEIAGFMDTFKSYGMEHVFLAGGEPLLHPDLPFAVRYGLSIGLRVSVSTNGHLLDFETARSLADAGMTHDLSISLDGPNARVNDLIRGRGSFESALLGMYAVQTHTDILWGVNYVSCRINLGEALETANLAARMGASYFNLVRFTLSGRGIANRGAYMIDDGEYLSEIDSLSEEYQRMGEFYGDIYLFDLTGDLADTATSYFNHSKFESMPSGISIDSAGDVQLTPAGVRLGNCRNVPLSTIIESIGSPEVAAMYGMWLRGEREGVHKASPSFRVIA